jgi:hypothetical protein
MDNDINSDLERVETPQGDFFKYVFLVPLAAPLPNELSDFVTEGPLLTRLAPLAMEAPEDEFAIVAISGAELTALERSWRLFQEAKKVAVLTELPGARYDILFTQATRQIGLRSIPWPSIEEGLSAKLIANQRAGDRSPWKKEEEKLSDASQSDESSKELDRRFSGPSSLRDVANAVPIPDSSEEEDDEDTI